MKITLLFIVWLSICIFWVDFFTQSGTYFFLDTLFFEKHTLTPLIEQTLYWHIVDIGTTIFGYTLFTKIWLFIIYLFWVILWISISSYINSLFSTQKSTIFLSYLWVCFIILNPFIYERFITQTHIVLWIFCIWLGLVSILKHIKSQSKLALYTWAFFLWSSISIFPHAVIFLGIIWITTLIFYWKHFSLKNIILSIIIIFFININWIVWNIFYQTKSTIDTIATFNYQNIEAFSSNSLSWLWTELTNLLLYGFWGEKSQHIYTPEIINQKWYIAWFLVLSIILFWIVILYKKEKKLTFYLLFLWITAYILSLWVSSDIFKIFNIFLYDHIPYYIGMREPQKLTGLVMIIYSVFFLSWIYWLYNISIKYNLKEYLHIYILNVYSVFILLFFIIIAWSPNVLFWFNGQLKISNYPEGLFEARNYLLANSPLSKSLILPWHSYIACSWTHWKIVSNVAHSIFLPLNSISSDNIEIWTVYTNSSDPQSKVIEDFLKNKDYSLLKDLWISNIIFLDNCADYKKYSYLDSSSKVKMIFNSQDIKIYNLQ